MLRAVALESQFLFATCQVGAERILKEELAQRVPHLHPAFQRPGFITFKETRSGKSVTPDVALGAVFARAYGMSIGEAFAQDTEATERVASTARRIAEVAPGAAVQVWLRDQSAPGEELDDVARADEVTRVSQALVAAGARVVTEPALGELVIDVVLLEEGTWWLGAHVHTIDHPPSDVLVPHPAEAPSRAYRKVEEAIRWFGMPLRENDTAVELGSAPGGVVYALLNRGLRVVGVDPGAMADVVKSNSRFKHVASSAFDVRAGDLPKRIDWALLDMNTEPDLGIRAIDHLNKLGRAPALGAILTLKLNQPSFSKRIPELVSRVKQMRFVEVYAKQLTNNRREITVVGLTNEGVRRKRML